MLTDKERISLSIIRGTGNTKYSREQIIDKIYAGQLQYVDKLIDELLNLSINNITFFNAEETYIIRKHLGIFDDGKRQSYNQIAHQTNQSEHMIRKCITTFYSYIAELIYHLKGNHVYEVWDNRTKMSSLSIIRNKKYNNFPISKLDIDRDIIQRLYANNIYSLYDLLSYSQYDFCRKPLIIGKHCFKQIKEVIHSLGLKFITELSDDEKRLIIAFCSEDVINNSSLSWITFLDKSLIQRMNVDIDNPITIGNLKKYQSIDILCYRQANFKAINYATSIGINISGYKVKKDITQNNYAQYMSLMDVLNIKIEEIEMSINLYYKLKNLGINIIKDIICHSLEDFYFDENSQDLEQELANIINYLGLSFANDSTILNDYLKEISFQLSPPKSISIPEEEIIVRQYQSLVGQSNRLPSDIRENGFEKIYTETGYEKRTFRNFQN